VGADGLLAALDVDDPDALVAALVGATVAERDLAWAGGSGRFRSPRWHHGMATLQGEARARRFQTQALFALGVGPPEVVRVVGGFVFGVPSDDEFRAIVGQRAQGWRSDFAQASLRTWAAEKEVGLLGPVWWETWQRIRRYERAGVIPFDARSADYLVCLVRGLTFSDSIEDALLADSDLLQQQVWLLFQPGDGVQRALLGADRYFDPANTWRPALVRLALGGQLDDRRLREAADAAAADERMGRNHRAWYRRIPEMLDNPALLPAQAEGGLPPAGNRLWR
jgi:hypothetical protein